MHRRSLLLAATAATVAPAITRAASATTLRFIPVIDLAYLDPVFATAQVTRNHAFMVFDTLYGMSADLVPSPQMVEGHRVERDGLLWDLTLRDGLWWHDGERVLARDCVASIRRWSRRDAFGIALMAATDELSAPDDRTIRFQLKRPFPLLPTALGKAAIQPCFMMPERLAETDPFRQIPEVVGSGPFRFVADERLSGARNVYARFDRYRPREGAADWTAGGKVVHYDRVVWTTMPDAATGTAAVQAGEQDWQETTPHDLLPVLRRNRNLRVTVLDPRGFNCILQVNHLQAPFNNPAIRRALWGAVDQEAFMMAVAGDNPEYRHHPAGFFCPGTPMASSAGLEVLQGPRDYDKVKRDLTAAGYRGEKVVVLVPADSLAQKPLGDVAVDMFRRAGMNVESQAMDFATVFQRRNRRDPVEQGGWSAVAANWQGIDWLNPAGHLTLQADGTYPGWYRSERIQELRSQWLGTGDLAEQQRICRDIQLIAMEEVPFYPIGQYFQPSVHRTPITGIGRGTVVFWNVRPA